MGYYVGGFLNPRRFLLILVNLRVKNVNMSYNLLDYIILEHQMGFEAPAPPSPQQKNGE